MGRSVSRPSNTIALTYTHLESEAGDDDDIAQMNWDDFTANVKAAVQEGFPVRWRECDVWHDREDHGVLKCDYALFGYSEYCGLVSVWMVPVTPEEDDDATEVLAFGLFAGCAQERLEKAVIEANGEILRHRGTFSNGEAVFDRSEGARMSTDEPNSRQRDRIDAVRGKDMKDIHDCTVCGKDLEPTRKHTDTCGERCFATLCEWQRQAR